MFSKTYFHNRELGLGYKKDCFDLQFLLPRFRCRTNDVFCVQGMDSNVPPISVQYCRVPGREHICALACEDGEIIFMDTKLPAKKSCVKHWSAHSNAVFDVAWLPKSSHFITASGDKTAVLWDTTTIERISTFKGHNCSLKSVSLKPDIESIFVTGSRDGNILLWDSRMSTNPNHKPVASVLGAHSVTVPSRRRKRLRKGIIPSVTDPRNSITAVLFQDENTFISTGSSDWTIKGWDLRWMQSNSNSPLPVFHISQARENNKAHGYTSLVMSPDKKYFFANCTDGTICQCEIHGVAPEIVSQYYGHHVGTFFVKMDVSCDGQFIVSGSSDNKAYIWKVTNPGMPIATLDGHNAEVTAVAWDPEDITKLITCGDDEKVFHWRIGEDKDVSDEDNCGINPLLGTHQYIEPEDIRAPWYLHQHTTPLSFTTPSASSPFISSSRSSAGSDSSRSSVVPRLTQWFTPKTKTGDIHPNYVTPKMDLSAQLEAVTPVKVQQRAVLGEINTSEVSDMRKLTSIRRTINFGGQNDSKSVSPLNRVKKPKLGSSKDSYSIKKFFQAEPKTRI